jgi:TolB-like protein/tetratricopeptide (TPR) repeat protein
MSDRLARLQEALGNRYAIQRELGRGGMATVYLAEDLKHHRPVALKVFQPELAVVLGTERFLREIALCARLTHPHILPLHDSGDADGFLYYVMPYVEGESLRDRLTRDKQLPVDDTLQIGREVADALSYAHGRCVIHRDIKPENILLEAGHAVVADFGIARAIDAAGGDRLTETGVSLGTPAYMSPEQAAGSKDLDGRSDLYSLGCVLYEMLAGQPPFTGPMVESVVHQHLAAEPRPVTVLRAAVQPAVARALSRALAKTPADRFRTAAEFAAALAAGGEGAETAASVAAGTASIAVLPFLNLSGDPDNEYFSDGLAEDIIDALTQVPGLHVMARTSAFAFRGKEQDIRRIGAELNVEHILEGSVRRAGNRLRMTAQLVKVSDGYHLWSQRFDRELTDVFAVQDEISQAIVEKLRVRLAGDRPLVKRHTDNVEAYHLFLRGRHCVYRMTPESLEKGREYLEQAIALDPDYALAHAGMADYYAVSAVWGHLNPMEALPKAESAAMEALSRDDTLAEAHAALGLVLGTTHFDWARAEQECRRALELNPASPIAPYTYGFWVLRPMGRLDEAVPQLQRAVELDPLSALYNTLLAYLYHARGQADLAIAQHQRAIDLDPGWYFPPWLMSIAYQHMGRHDEAIAAAERACELSDRHPDTLGILGLAYGLAGRHGEARALLEELLAKRRRIYVPPFAMAAVYRGLGELDAALEWLEKGVEERDYIVVGGLKSEPRYILLRGHPRYQTLLRKMNLEA